MDRRAFLLSGGAVAAAGILPGALARLPAPTADAELRALLDRFFYDRLADDPEQATSLGLDTGERAALRAKLGDNSVSGETRRKTRADAERAALARIDPARLGPTARIDYDVVLYQLDRARAAHRFSYGNGFAPYVLTQQHGAYLDVPDFLQSTHRIVDAADADAYLARLAAFPQAIDNDTEHQRIDAARGVFAPDYILDTTLKLLAAVRDVPAGETVMVTALARQLLDARLPPARAAEAERIVRDAVFPALDRQRALVTALRAKASHDAGVWRLPGGTAYYELAAESFTTVAMTGEDIHRLGLEQVASLTDRIDRILKIQGLSQGSVGERLVALNQRPDQLYPDTDQGKEALLNQLRGQIETMYRRLPHAFATLPRAPVEVRRVPPSIQAGAPGGYYQPGSIDGSRPAIYFINLRDTFDRPKFGLATLSHHEAVPGHHLQGTLALESRDIPLIRRHSFFSGYGEGWALYAEQLADELGMYDSDPLGQIGYLQSLLFRATRLVVDSGMHVKRWSREQSTDYFIASTGIARGRSQGEIDRYTVNPGQACSYKIGHTAWVRLREEARARQAGRFDLRHFHEVLTLGAMPLSVLERVVGERFV